MKILVPGNVPFDAMPLLDDPADVAVPYVMREPIPDEHSDADVLVSWASPPALLADAARRLTRLRWVQTLNAGPDAALAAGFARNVVISSGRGLHDITVTEHTLALALTLVRGIGTVAAAQREHRWDSEFGREQARNYRTYTLDGARVTIWGFGSIASRLAPHLAALGAQVTGVARNVGTVAGFPVVDEAALPALLAETDLLICLLPATAANRHIIDDAVFARLPSGARFVNVGRGATLDESALIAALTSGRLRNAAIDVAEVEPLPADSPLWDTPNLLITPHIAGNRPQGVATFLTEQIRAWKAGGAAALRNVVAR